MITEYRRSDGTLVDPRTMDPDHVKSALAKLQREAPDRVEEIELLQSVADHNRDTLATKMAPYIRQGWRHRKVFDAQGKRSFDFYNENTPDAPPKNIEAKNDDGAWAKWVAAQEAGE